MKKRQKDQLAAVVVLLLGMGCLLIGGYSAMKRQLFEALVLLAVANVLFICGAAAYTRSSVEQKIHEACETICDQIRACGTTGQETQE